MATISLDLTGLKCPLPAMKTKKALAKLHPGDMLDVRCTDPMSAIDIPNLIQQTGDRLIDMTRDNDGVSFLIEKNRSKFAIAA